MRALENPTHFAVSLYLERFVSIYNVVLKIGFYVTHAP